MVALCSPPTPPPTDPRAPLELGQARELLLAARPDRGAASVVVRDGAPATTVAFGRERPRDPRLAPAESSPLSLGALLRAELPRLRAEGRVQPGAAPVLSRLSRCRTRAMGGVLEHCLDRGCGYAQGVFRSCGDRHCPTCGGLKGLRWLEKALERTLPVPSRHVVCTLPPALRPLARGSSRQVNKALMRAARQAVEETASARLGEPVRLGVTSVLHTWNRWFTHHPHVHLIVTDGGLSRATGRWREPERRQCLLPGVEVGRRFRAHLIAELDREWRKGRLRLDGLEELRQPAAWRALLDGLPARMEAYAKRSLAGPAEAFAYLARYTTRVGLTNARLLAFDEERGLVSLRTKEGEQFQLTVDELVARLQLHILPSRMHRISHSGLFAPRSRALLEQARAQLLDRLPSAPPAPMPELALEGQAGGTRPRETALETYERLTGVDLSRCPRCGEPLALAPLAPWQDPHKLATALGVTLDKRSPT